MRSPESRLGQDPALADDPEVGSQFVIIAEGPVSERRRH